MGSYFNVFQKLDDFLKEDIVTKSAFYISDKAYIEKNFKNLDKKTYLKEWELYSLDKNITYNPEILKRIETEYFSNESIWRGIINDRRLYNGVYCKYKQDYNSTFSEGQILSVFQKTFLTIEDFFNSFSPDLIVGSNPSTLGEYIIMIIAQKRGVKIIIPRHTKIKNYFTVVNNLSENFPKIISSFNKKLFDRDSQEAAQNYIEEFNKKNGIVYEGSIIRGNFLLKNTIKFVLDFPKLFVKQYLIKPFKKIDLHSRGNDIYKAYLIGILKDLRSLYYQKRHQKLFINLNSIKERKYIYFPLHSEPEVAITLYSKGYYNQIELIREISFNLPIGYMLIVNEHPRNVGKRKIGYYKKLSSIPNVSIASFEVKSFDVIKHSSLVVVLSGFIGFEASLLRKPVVSLGIANYNILPKKIINSVKNIKDLYSEIQYSLKNYQYDEATLLDYLSSIISNSTKINFYNVLLSKNRMGKSSDLNSFEENLMSLARLIKSNAIEKN